MERDARISKFHRLRCMAARPLCRRAKHADGTMRRGGVPQAHASFEVDGTSGVLATVCLQSLWWQFLREGILI